METPKYLIGRQPILNRQEQIVAYELLFRSAESKSAASMKSASQATASVIMNTLSGFGIKEILGDKQGFINVDVEILMNNAIEILPKEMIGLELVGNILFNDVVIDRCRFLKEMGFVIALDDRDYTPELEEIYRLVDIIKVDLMQTPAEKLSTVIKELKRYPAKILAEKVDTNDAFNNCAKLGFDYFQGYFFARPSLIEKKRIDGYSSAMMQLLKLILADATFTEMEKVFRNSPALTYKLLLLVNSVSVGVREKIRDVRHALTILGRQQIKRWIQLALFTTENSQDIESPLVEMATARAGFMEQIAMEHPVLSKIHSAPDQAFMVGILSLLDSIYQVSIEQIVADLNLSDEVRSALVTRQGVYGKMLELTEMMERLELGSAAIGLQELGVSLDGIIASQIKSLSSKVI
ncbi:HDOD domain-containing protein [Geobacter pelophilus]|uniref:HDOD domain-containing protein n=1 Tax=Geoanaerobacter pelophilus TaxID=60036 RepID=A0AAW4L170_9BACT|nr:HDOD domain-containing protein [Geoanaerobacter pelophilus]MBT0664454.1 HDOD domain-containing protein [Geoanaerobacter pelophilus]